MSEEVQVFVYGTFRPPQPDTSPDDSRYYAHIDPYVQACVPARLPEATLYDLGTYPAATPGEGIILGDLLKLAPAALPVMDRIEGHPNFYRRAKATVVTEHGPAEAWIYWAPDDLVSGNQPLWTGDWLKRHQQPAEPAGARGGQARPRAERPAVDSTLLKLVKRLASAQSVWLTTVRPDSRPHSAPVWCVWHQSRFYVVTTTSAAKVTNIYHNPSVVVTHPDPSAPVILEGWATSAARMHSQLRDKFQAKYHWDIESSPKYDTVIEITPIKLLAWGKHGEGRWPGSALKAIRSL